MSDIPGTPGERTIGGQPLSEAASDDSGGGGDDNDSGGGSSSGGGGGDSDDDDVIAGEFSGDEVREALNSDQSLEEVNDPDEHAEGFDPDSGGGGGGSSDSEPEVVEKDIDFDTDAGDTVRVDPVPDSGTDSSQDAVGDSPFLGGSGGSDSDSGGSSGSSGSSGGSNEGSTGSGGSSPSGSQESRSSEPTQQPDPPSTDDQTETVDADPPPGRTLTGPEVERLVEAQQDPNVSPDRYSQLKQSLLQNESVPEGTAAYRIQRDVVDELDQVDQNEEVEVVRQGDELQARPTDEGREAIAEEVAADSQSLDQSDFEVRDDFSTQLSESGQRQLERDVASAMAGLSASEIDVTGRGQLTEQSRQEIAQSVASRNDMLSSDNVTVGPTGDVSFTGDAVVSTGQTPQQSGVEQSRGQTEVFIDDLPNGGLEDTRQQPMPTQTTQAQSVFDQDYNTDETIDELTTGGVLTEEFESEIRDRSERWRDANRFVAGEVGDAVGGGLEATTGGRLDEDSVPAQAVEGVVSAPGAVTNPFQAANLWETSVEVTEETVADTLNPNKQNIVEEQGIDSTLAATSTVGGAIAAGTAKQAAQNPARFAGQLVGEFATGAAAGLAGGRALRSVQSRTSTVGGERIDPTGLVNEDTIRYYDPGTTDAPEGDRFPGAQDPDLYESDPAQAVSQQAEKFDPDAIRQQFDEAGVDAGVDVKKALDVEPEGPDGGRGFEASPAESIDDFEYETPGAFVGPELSPNFLGLGDSGASFSLRPGLPDTGNRPTAVIARTDVESPDAQDLQNFNEEMVERAGETTARTKPPDEVSVEEIEAVIPPSARFEEVGGGGVPVPGLGRIGGTDFYTEVGGRRVPIRTVAPEGTVDPTRTGPLSDINVDAGVVEDPDASLFDVRVGDPDSSALARFVQDERGSDVSPGDVTAAVSSRVGGSVPQSFRSFVADDSGASATPADAVPDVSGESPSAPSSLLDFAADERGADATPADVLPDDARAPTSDDLPDPVSEFLGDEAGADVTPGDAAARIDSTAVTDRLPDSVNRFLEDETGAGTTPGDVTDAVSERVSERTPEPVSRFLRDDTGADQTPGDIAAGVASRISDRTPEPVSRFLADERGADVTPADATPGVGEAARDRLPDQAASFLADERGADPTPADALPAGVEERGPWASQLQDFASDERGATATPADAIPESETLDEIGAGAQRFAADERGVDATPADYVPEAPDAADRAATSLQQFAGDDAGGDVTPADVVPGTSADRSMAGSGLGSRLREFASDERGLDTTPADYVPSTDRLPSLSGSGDRVGTPFGDFVDDTRGADATPADFVPSTDRSFRVDIGDVGESRAGPGAGSAVDDLGDAADDLPGRPDESGSSGRPLSEFEERAQPPTDRPVPVNPFQDASSRSSSDTQSSPPASSGGSGIDSSAAAGYGGFSSPVGGSGSSGFDPSGGLFEGGPSGGGSDPSSLGPSGGPDSPSGGSSPPSEPGTPTNPSSGSPGSPGTSSLPPTSGPTSSTPPQFPDWDDDTDEQFGSFESFDPQEFDNPVANPSDVLF